MSGTDRYVLGAVWYGMEREGCAGVQTWRYEARSLWVVGMDTVCSAVLLFRRLCRTTLAYVSTAHHVAPYAKRALPYRHSLRQYRTPRSTIR
eukprot:785426-Rhodomonas_salina.2